MGNLARGYTITAGGILMVEGTITDVEFDAQTDRLLVITEGGVIAIPRREIPLRPHLGGLNETRYD